LDLRERELYYAGRFVYLNLGSFSIFSLARLTGLLWWLFGAWVIFRWSGQLHGRMAGYFGLALWSFIPIVLAHEQIATPELPTAVICATATYAFRNYLLTPSWERILIAGLLLGAAQLTEFAALALLIIWPLLALVYCLVRRDRASPRGGLRTRLLQAAAVMALSGWVINVGYGFDGSGTSLGRFDFASTTLKGDLQPPTERPGGRDLGNRFRGTWLGRVIVPLPADFVKGLDRRWQERGTAVVRRGEEEWPVELAGRPRSIIGGWLPIGIWAMMLVSLFLLVSRHSSGASWAEELTLWLPALVFLALPREAIGPLSTAAGSLLATPFLIIIASKLAYFLRPGRWKAGWLVAALSLWSVGDCLRTSYNQFFTIERRTRFRQELVRHGWRLGLAVPEPKTSVGSAAEERGLIYRTFVDSRGAEMNYALFVPESYHGDRPYPLVLFLHGWGDRATTDGWNRMFTQVGLPFTLKYRAIDFLVLCPQGRSGYWDAGGDDALRSMELLSAVQKEYRVDPKRISLTGLSSGGSGACDLAARYPDRWAAIVPVAGTGDPGQAPLIKHIPYWCFHNHYDAMAPVEGPRRMIQALRALGGDPKYTEYLDTNHNAGERAYVLPELYDWLAQQRRP
jgi:predicted esterase